MDDDDAIERIYRALVERELDAEDLSARRIASLLGKTTGAIYHRWGSLDGLLFSVSQRGFTDLRAALESTWARTRNMADCAQVYVELGLDRPELYPLMFERAYDWDALRAVGFFAKATPSSELLAGVLCLLGEAGSTRPIADARLLMAGLHGIVAFATSGRMNVGELGAPDREVAIAAARDLATRLLPPPATPPKKKKKARA